MKHRYRIKVSRYIYQTADSPEQAADRCRSKGYIKDKEIIEKVEPEFKVTHNGHNG